MVEPRTVGLREGDQVMIARVRAVHERNAVAGVVGEPQAECVGVELRERVTSDVNRSVCERRRGRTFGAFERADAAPAPRGTTGGVRGNGLRSGRHLRRDEHVDEDAFRIAEPQAGGLRLRMRVGRLHAELREALLQRAHVLRECAEREVLEPLRRAAAQYRAPAVRMADRVQMKTIVAPLHLEAEVVVETRGRVEVGDREDEVIERMHRGDAGAPRGRGFCCHGSSYATACSAPIIAPDAGVP